MYTKMVRFQLVVALLFLLAACGGGGGSGSGGSTPPPPPAGDTTPPNVTITSPVTGSYASGTILVSASASDSSGISKVELYRDSVLLETKTVAPYTFTWDTTSLTNGGSYALTVKAYDAVGNTASSSAVSVGIRQMRVKSVGTATNIHGYEMSITIPNGATIVAVPVSGDLLHVTAYGTPGLLQTTYSPLFVSLTYSSAMGTGDVVAINCTLAPDSTVQPTDFIFNSFQALDQGGAPIGAVTPLSY